MAWVIKNDRPISCWNCKHFAPVFDEDTGQPLAMGECRALPPVGCCDLASGQVEPVYPDIFPPKDYWCSAWQQTQIDLDKIVLI